MRSAPNAVDTHNAVAAHDAQTNALVALVAEGQSVWLDFISRDLVRGGQLRCLIEQDGLRGMTSNPSIFQKAIAAGDAYDEQLAQLAAAGRTAGEISEALSLQLAGLLGGLYAVPLAGVLWVLLGAAYRNAVALSAPPRRWALPRWQRGMPVPARPPV